METAAYLKEVCESLDILFIYKSSFDKANRSSHESFRGPGISEGLRILDKVKTQVQVPVLTDVHEDTPLDEIKDVVSVLADASVSLPADQLYSTGCQSGPARQYQKGSVSGPMGHATCRQQSQGNRQ